MKVASVIVLYRPKQSSLKLISDCVRQFDVAIVVVNEAKPGFLSLISSKNLITIYNEKNLGLGKALNQGMARAIESSCDAVVTFDQDSQIESDFRIRMQGHYQNLSLGHRIGLLSPSKFDITSKQSLSPILELYPHPVKMAITSGAFFSMSAFKETGFFCEEFFVDYIDLEYCLRLRKNKYELFQIPEVHIYHQYGDLTWHQFGPIAFCASHHSMERRLLITKNRFICYKKYFFLDPLWVFQDLGSFFKETIKIILVESEKLKKINAVFKGIGAGLCH